MLPNTRAGWLEILWETLVVYRMSCFIYYYVAMMYKLVNCNSKNDARPRFEVLTIHEHLSLLGTVAGSYCLFLFIKICVPAVLYMCRCFPAIDW